MLYFPQYHPAYNKHKLVINTVNNLPQEVMIVQKEKIN